MKKTLVAVLGIAMLAPMTWAQTNVLSQNAVGYVKITVPGNGGLFLARYDFESIDGSPQAVSQVVGEGIPVGTRVHKWDRSTVPNGYTTSTFEFDLFAGGNKWNPDQTIERGDVFWVQTAAGEAAEEIYLLGEVPGANNGSETTLLSPATAFLGFPYPANTTLGGSAVGTVAPEGTAFYSWTGAAWSSANVKEFDLFAGEVKWTDPDVIIPPGAGFFIVAGADFDATEVKPYAWP